MRLFVDVFNQKMDHLFFSLPDVVLLCFCELQPFSTLVATGRAGGSPHLLFGGLQLAATGRGLFHPMPFPHAGTVCGLVLPEVDVSGLPRSILQSWIRCEKQQLKTTSLDHPVGVPCLEAE